MHVHNDWHAHKLSFCSHVMFISASIEVRGMPDCRLAAVACAAAADVTACVLADLARLTMLCTRKLCCQVIVMADYRPVAAFFLKAVCIPILLTNLDLTIAPM